MANCNILRYWSAVDLLSSDIEFATSHLAHRLLENAGPNEFLTRSICHFPQQLREFPALGGISAEYNNQTAQ